jgi:hypothetical protein
MPANLMFWSGLQTALCAKAAGADKLALSARAVDKVFKNFMFVSSFK